MKKSILIIVVLLNFFGCKGQQSVDSIAMAYADSVIDTLLVEKNLNDYLLYSVRDKLIVIEKQPSSFTVYYISSLHGLERKETDPLSKNELLRLFDENSYSLSRSYSGKKYESSCPSSFIYFRYVKQEVKLVEFNLPSMLLCSKEKITYPIADDLHKKLFEMITNREWQK